MMVLIFTLSASSAFTAAPMRALGEEATRVGSKQDGQNGTMGRRGGEKWGWHQGCK